MSDLHLVDPQGWEYDLQSVCFFRYFDDGMDDADEPHLSGLFGLHGLFPTPQYTMVRYLSHIDANVPLTLLATITGTIARGVSSLRRLNSSSPSPGPWSSSQIYARAVHTSSRA